MLPGHSRKQSCTQPQEDLPAPAHPCCCELANSCLFQIRPRHEEKNPRDPVSCFNWLLYCHATLASPQQTSSTYIPRFSTQGMHKRVCRHPSWGTTTENQQYLIKCVLLVPPFKIVVFPLDGVTELLSLSLLFWFDFFHWWLYSSYLWMSYFMKLLQLMD